jgi:hypothetical protein
MFEELPLAVPVAVEVPPVVVQVPAEELPGVHHLAAPSPEEARAVEAVFTQDQESATVVRLLGLWTGTMLLHDLAKETFTPPAGEVETERKDKGKRGQGKP